MHTDRQFFKIFTAGPHWLYLLLGEPAPAAGCTMMSVTQKDVERRLDGLVCPTLDHEPLMIVEFQGVRDLLIYPRIVAEMALSEIAHDGREVRGLIVFLDSKLDPGTKTWTQVRAVYLPEALRNLAAQQPDHPLLDTFMPLMEDKDAVVESRASACYQKINSSPLPDSERQALADTFVSWLMSRFRNNSYQEIMNLLDLPSLKDTRSGRELWEEGNLQGREKGIEEGIEKGIEKGKHAAILRMVKRKFLALDAASWEALDGLTEMQLDALADELLFLPNEEALEAWLADLAKHG